MPGLAMRTRERAQQCLQRRQEVNRMDASLRRPKIQGGFPMDEQAASSLRVEWLADLGKIQALRRDWMELESKVRDRTVYVTHDYVVAWYKGYGGTKHTAFGKPLVGAVWDGPTLVGVAPFIACRPTLG